MKKIKLIPDRNCPKCGNPKVMYYCNECECSCEEKTCLTCGIPTKLDKKYHDNCGNPSIVIPMTEQDLDDIRNGEEFHWTFETDDGLSIDTIIRLENEKDNE